MGKSLIISGADFNINGIRVGQFLPKVPYWSVNAFIYHSDHKIYSNNGNVTSAFLVSANHTYKIKKTTQVGGDANYQKDYLALSDNTAITRPNPTSQGVSIGTITPLLTSGATIVPPFDYTITPANNQTILVTYGVGENLIFDEIIG